MTDVNQTLRLRATLAAVLLLLSSPLAAEQSNWVFEGWSGPPIFVRMFVPDNVKEDSSIIIVMHGASRDAKRYFKDWKALGRKLGLIIVVPEYSKKHFPSSKEYNLGHVYHAETGLRRPEESWTFSSIEPLFDDAVLRVAGKQTEYAIYGHSAGSQFVHRFMYYKPDARVSKYVAANAGWYTLPVNEFQYPYGFEDSGLGDEHLAAIFAKPLIILLGREDTDPNGKSLRNTVEARRQGPHRLARGLTMQRAAKSRAEELGLDFKWQLAVVNGADHVNAKMAPAAAALIVAK